MKHIYSLLIFVGIVLILTPYAGVPIRFEEYVFYFSGVVVVVCAVYLARKASPCVADTSSSADLDDSPGTYKSVGEVIEESEFVQHPESFSAPDESVDDAVSAESDTEDTEDSEVSDDSLDDELSRPGWTKHDPTL